MNKEEYLSALAIKEASETLPEEKRELFVNWMLKRFHTLPNFTHISYAMEWATRFKNDPRGAMDSLSLAIYNELV